jgi:hypothetical protein
LLSQIIESSNIFSINVEKAKKYFTADQFGKMIKCGTGWSISVTRQ